MHRQQGGGIALLQLLANLRHPARLLALRQLRRLCQRLLHQLPFGLPFLLIIIHLVNVLTVDQHVFFKPAHIR